MSLSYRDYRERMRGLIAGLRILRGACAACGRDPLVGRHDSCRDLHENAITRRAAERARSLASRDLARRSDCDDS